MWRRRPPRRSSPILIQCDEERTVRLPLARAARTGIDRLYHLQVRTVFKVRGARTLNTLADSVWGKLRIGLEYALRRSGPMSMAPSQFGMFTKSDPARATPDLEYHVQPLSTDRLGDPLHPFPAITMSVCNLRPESREGVM